MNIKINLFSSLKKYMPVSTDNCIINLTEGTTVKEILCELNVPLDEVKLIFINGIHANTENIIKEGDRIGVFPPVGGG